VVSQVDVCVHVVVCVSLCVVVVVCSVSVIVVLCVFVLLSVFNNASNDPSVKSIKSVCVTVNKCEVIIRAKLFCSKHCDIYLCIKAYWGWYSFCNTRCLCVFITRPILICFGFFAVAFMLALFLNAMQCFYIYIFFLRTLPDLFQVTFESSPNKRIKSIICYKVLVKDAGKKEST